jgi:hypothetical protein
MTPSIHKIEVQYYDDGWWIANWHPLMHFLEFDDMLVARREGLPRCPFLCKPLDKGGVE